MLKSQSNEQKSKIKHLEHENKAMVTNVERLEDTIFKMDQKCKMMRKQLA